MRLVEEQFNVEKLLGELDKAKTDEELLTAARNLKLFRKQEEWLKLKIDKLFENEQLPKNTNG
jgi:hypothetical protein